MVVVLLSTKRTTRESWSHVQQLVHITPFYCHCENRSKESDVIIIINIRRPFLQQQNKQGVWLGYRMSFLFHLEANAVAMNFGEQEWRRTSNRKTSCPKEEDNKRVRASYHLICVHMCAFHLICVPMCAFHLILGWVHKLEHLSTASGGGRGTHKYHFPNQAHQTP